MLLAKPACRRVEDDTARKVRFFFKLKHKANNLVQKHMHSLISLWIKINYQNVCYTLLPAFTPPCLHAIDVKSHR